MSLVIKYGGMAQLVGQQTVNLWVVGSSPTVTANLKSEYRKDAYSKLYIDLDIKDINNKSFLSLCVIWCAECFGEINLSWVSIACPPNWDFVKYIASSSFLYSMY